jgi:hypothetical protein
MSQLQEILQVSEKGVDYEGAHKARGGPWIGPRHMFSGRKRHMNSPIMPIQGPADLSTANPAAGSDTADFGTFVSELAASETMLAPVAARGAPPQQVLDQMAAASRIHERLRESGEQVRFITAAPGGPTRIEIHDGEGNLVRSLSTVEAFELAAGAGSR